MRGTREDSTAGPDSLGNRVGTLEVGVRKDHRQLFASVPGRVIDLA